MLNAFSAAWPEAASQWDAEVANFAEVGAVARELRQLYDTNGRDFRALHQLVATSLHRMSPAAP